VPDNVIAGAPTTSGSIAGMGSMSGASGNVLDNALCITTPGNNDGVLRLNPAIQDSARTVRGYVWHCHVLDHEDNEMMLPLRLS
jgi:hypothetical protein